MTVHRRPDRRQVLVGEAGIGGEDHCMVPVARQLREGPYFRERIKECAQFLSHFLPVRGSNAAGACLDVPRESLLSLPRRQLKGHANYCLRLTNAILCLILVQIGFEAGLLREDRAAPSVRRYSHLKFQAAFADRNPNALSVSMISVRRIIF